MMRELPGGRERYGEESGHQFSLRDVLYVFFLHKWKIAVLFFLVCGAGFVFISGLPNQYQSSAKVLVKLGRGSLTGDEEINIPQGGGALSGMQNALEILKSQAVAERVIGEVGVDAILQPPQVLSPTGKWVQKVMGKISPTAPVDPDSPEYKAARHAIAIRLLADRLELSVKGNVIDMDYTARDPQLAHTVLESVLAAFLQANLEANRAALRPEFFEEESRKARAALDKKAKELEDMKARYNITSIDKQIELCVATAAQMKTNLMNNAAAISASEAKITALEQVLATQDKTVLVSSFQVESPLVAGLRQGLTDLKIKKAELVSKYPEDSRFVQDVNKEIEIKETALQEETKSGNSGSYGTNTNRQQVEVTLATEKANLVGLKAPEADLKAALASAEAQLAELASASTSFKNLERELAVLENDYAQSHRNVQRSQLARTLDEENVSNMSVLQPATLQPDRIGPNRRRNYALLVFASALGSLGVAVLLYSVDHTLKRDEDVEKHLGLPLLATVSEIEFKSCI